MVDLDLRGHGRWAGLVKAAGPGSAYEAALLDAMVRWGVAGIPVAMRIAIVGRSQSWKRALGGIPVDDRGEWGDAVGGWLLELFEPSLI